MKTKIALILAGGISRRFTPLTTQKPLFPFLGKKLLDYTVSAVRKAGFSEIVVVSNKENASLLRKSFFRVAVQTLPTGMAGGVLAASDFIKGKSVFILNATDQVEQELLQRAYLKTKENKPFLTALKQENYFPGGYLKFKNRRVWEIVEKPGAGKRPSKFVNLVFDYFPQADVLLDFLKNTTSHQDDVFEKALSKMLQKFEFSLLEYQGEWQALKYPWHVLDLAEFLLKHRLRPKNKAFQIAGSAFVGKDVYLAKGVRILENAVVKGPSYIGANTVIGTGSLILNSLIESDCVIGGACEVTRSYVGSGSWLHRNYIGDSVLEGDNHFGAGAVTANFRFDQQQINSLVKGVKTNTQRKKLGAVLAKHVRVGVNASLMPGIKLYANSIVGPGTVVYKDLGENKKLYQSQLETKTCNS